VPERIEDRLKQMMVERLFLKVKPESIAEDAPLMKTVGLEEVYGISFDDEEFDVEIFRTVRSIADFVRGKQAKQVKAAG